MVLGSFHACHVIWCDVFVWSVQTVLMWLRRGSMARHVAAWTCLPDCMRRRSILIAFPFPCVTEPEQQSSVRANETFKKCPCHQVPCDVVVRSTENMMLVPQSPFPFLPVPLSKLLRECKKKSQASFALRRELQQEENITARRKQNAMRRLLPAQTPRYADWYSGALRRAGIGDTVMMWCGRIAHSTCMFQEQIQVRRDRFGG